MNIYKNIKIWVVAQNTLKQIQCGRHKAFPNRTPFLLYGQRTIRLTSRGSEKGRVAKTGRKREVIYNTGSTWEKVDMKENGGNKGWRMKDIYLKKQNILFLFICFLISTMLFMLGLIVLFFESSILNLQFFAFHFMFHEPVLFLTISSTISHHATICTNV